MLGFMFGALCLLLLFSMVSRRRRWAYAQGGGCGHRSWRHRRRHHHHHDHDHEQPRHWRARGFGRGARRAARRHLDLDEDQQELVDEAIRRARKAGKGLMDIVKDSRDELADAVLGDTLDQARLDAVFEKWDESLSEARSEVVDAIGRAHAALTPEQRRRLARWIDRDGTSWV